MSFWEAHRCEYQGFELLSVGSGRGCGRASGEGEPECEPEGDGAVVRESEREGCVVGNGVLSGGCLSGEGLRSMCTPRESCIRGGSRFCV